MRLISKPLHHFLDTKLRKTIKNSGELKRISKIDYQGNLHLILKPAKSKQVLIVPGSMIFSKINANQNAICLYKGPDSITSSIHYLSYPVKRDIIHPELFRYLLQTQECNRQIQLLYKSGIKTEISSRELLSIHLVFPPDPTDQQRLLDLIRKEDQWADSLVSQLEKTEKTILAFFQSWLNKSIQESISAEQINGVYPFSKIADIKVGKTPPVESFTKEGVPFIKMQQINENRIQLNGIPFYIDEECFRDLFSRTYAQAGDVLMNIVGPPLGKIAIIPDKLPLSAYNQALIRIRPFYPNSADWIFWFLNQESVIASLPKKGNAGQINISLKDIKAIQVPFPSEQDRIRLSGQALELHSTLQKINLALAELRGKTKLLKTKIVDHCLNQFIKND